MKTSVAPSPAADWLADQPELELVLCCCRTQLDPLHRQRIQSLVTPNLDWSRVVGLAQQNGVLPLLAWHLISPASPKETAVEGIPLTHLQIFYRDQPLQEYLRSTFRANLDRNLSLTTELLKLVQQFEAASIPILSFKGPLLAQLAYGHLGLRQFLDLDLLVPETEAVAAMRLLRQQGYQPQFDLSEAQQVRYGRLRNELSFWHEARQVAVDLHWDIFPKGFSFAPPAEQVWQGNVRVAIAGKSALTLSRENLLLFLCAHGAKHNWSHLSWICDVAELLHRHPELDWGLVQAQAGRFGTVTMLNLGLYLALSLLNAPLPDAIQVDLAQQPQLQAIGGAIQEAMLQPHIDSEPNPFAGQPIFWQTLESPRDKLWFWMDTVCTPTPLEWQIVPLPQSLFFLYYPIRLGRLLLKYSGSSLHG